jgi:hypothetical protein
LVPRPLDEGPRPKSGKLRLNLNGNLFWRENQLVWAKKTVLKESHYHLEENLAKLDNKTKYIYMYISKAESSNFLTTIVKIQ